jgi:hypothetical protein
VKGKITRNCNFKSAMMFVPPCIYHGLLYVTTTEVAGRTEQCQVLWSGCEARFGLKTSKYEWVPTTTTLGVNKKTCLRFEVLGVVKISTVVLWGLARDYRRFCIFGWYPFLRNLDIHLRLHSETTPKNHSPRKKSELFRQLTKRHRTEPSPDEKESPNPLFLSLKKNSCFIN